MNLHRKAFTFCKRLFKQAQIDKLILSFDSAINQRSNKHRFIEKTLM